MKSEIEKLFEQESTARSKLYEYLEEGSRHLNLYNNLDMYWCIVSNKLYMSDEPFTEEKIRNENYQSVEIVRAKIRAVKEFVCVTCNVRQFTDDHIEVLDNKKQCTDQSIIDCLKNW